MNENPNVKDTVTVKTNTGTREFKGELANPPKLVPALAIALLVHGKPQQVQNAVWNEAVRSNNEHYQQKMIQLARHYEIDPTNDWFCNELALCLAKDFIPGFGIIRSDAPRRGRPKSVSVDDKLALIREIEARRIKGSSVASACANLSRTNTQWKGKSAKSLEQRFLEYSAEVKKLRESLASPKPDPVWRRLKAIAETTSKAD